MKSDLIFEQAKELNAKTEHIFDGKYSLSIDFFSVTEENQKIYNKPIGDYFLLSIEKDIFGKKTEYYEKHLCEIIKKYINDNDNKFLIVGLGNKYISSDKLGTEVIKNIDVFSRDDKQTYAIAPSVSGLTGIESAEIVKAVSKLVEPDLIIVIDSLCASDISRLGTSIQINNGGIIPGAGVNNSRKGLTKKFLNCEVLMIGIPLVVYAKTYILSALEKYKIEFGINNKIDEMYNEDFDNQIVTIDKIDIVVKDLARLISNSINMALK